MRLRAKNQRIDIPGEEAIRVLREIELVLISLHKIGSYYAVAGDDQRNQYERETTRFIDEWKVTSRLAEARALLSQRFDSTLGEDEMDDLERAMEGLECWSGPESHPVSRP